MGAWFPALYDLAMTPLERGGFLEIRKMLLRESVQQWVDGDENTMRTETNKHHLPVPPYRYLDAAAVRIDQDPKCGA